MEIVFKKTRFSKCFFRSGFSMGPCQNPNHAAPKTLHTSVFDGKITTKLEYFLKIKFNKVLCEYEVYEQIDQGISRNAPQIQME